jgi:hypothetical protein
MFKRHKVKIEANANAPIKKRDLKSHGEMPLKNLQKLKRLERGGFRIKGEKRCSCRLNEYMTQLFISLSYMYLSRIRHHCLSITRNL